MSDPNDVIHISLETSQPGDNNLTIRMSPDSYPDLRASLEAAGVHTSDVYEFSVPQVVVATFGAFVSAGGMDGLAAVLTTFFERNKDKRIEFESNGERIVAEGIGAKELAKMLTVLRVQRDEKWRRVIEEQGLGPVRPAPKFEGEIEQPDDPT